MTGSDWDGKLKSWINRKRYLYVVLLVEMTARSNERLKKSAAAYGPSSKWVTHLVKGELIEFTFNRLASTRSVILAAEFSNTSSGSPPPTHPPTQPALPVRLLLGTHQWGAPIIKIISPDCSTSLSRTGSRRYSKRDGKNVERTRSPPRLADKTEEAACVMLMLLLLLAATPLEAMQETRCSRH